MVIMGEEDEDQLRKSGYDGQSHLPTLLRHLRDRYKAMTPRSEVGVIWIQ